jgi:hypothetical protein
MSPLGCNSPMRWGGLSVGPSSGTSLYYDLSQIMVVRGGLGVRVGRSLGAVCLAKGISGVVWFGIIAACSLINLCLCVMMPKNLVCAKEQSLLRRIFAILLSWRRATELVSGVLCPFRLRSEAMEGRTLAINNRNIHGMVQWPYWMNMMD